jgi:hypothetical protein
VDESSAQEIKTVEDAATLIDKLVIDKEGWNDGTLSFLQNSFEGHRV